MTTPANPHGKDTDMETLLKPFADFHGDLPDFDNPLRPCFESGIQYAVELLAKELGVTDWQICDGTEEFDGDLGGTLMNIVREAMPKDEHGEAMWPSEVRDTIARLDAERLSSPTEWPADAEFPLGAAVEKKGRAKWRGRVVGWYCTELTALGYAVESEFEPGSVQIYPATALVMREGDTSSPTGEYLWQLLSEHQSRDRTYMQIGRTDFLAALPLSDG